MKADSSVFHEHIRGYETTVSDKEAFGGLAARRGRAANYQETSTKKEGRWLMFEYINIGLWQGLA